jgi:2',3'-cyclic-nucleotide 2'-phosphodiesterase
VINLEGRVFMKPLDNPFPIALQLVEELKKQTNCILVDMHCEATSEKNAMGVHLDGKVSAVVGTHTHVQTADERILPRGTAAITDLGLTGGLDGIIGMKADISIERQLKVARGERMQPADGDLHLQGAVVDVDEATGLARSIERVNVPYERVLQGEFKRK